TVQGDPAVKQRHRLVADAVQGVAAGDSGALGGQARQDPAYTGAQHLLVVVAEGPVVLLGVDEGRAGYRGGGDGLGGRGAAGAGRLGGEQGVRPGPRTGEDDNEHAHHQGPAARWAATRRARGDRRWPLARQPWRGRGPPARARGTGVAVWPHGQLTGAQLRLTSHLPSSSADTAELGKVALAD